jgi:hypothetical protein
MGFVRSSETSEGTVSGPTRPAADFLCRRGWVALKSVTGTGVAETACCLATRSRSCRFRCANDLAEGGICQFEAETVNSQPGWLSDNLGCVKGGDRG